MAAGLTLPSVRCRRILCRIWRLQKVLRQLSDTMKCANFADEASDVASSLKSSRALLVRVWKVDRVTGNFAVRRASTSGKRSFVDLRSIESENSGAAAARNWRQIDHISSLPFRNTCHHDRSLFPETFSLTLSQLARLNRCFKAIHVTLFYYILHRKLKLRSKVILYTLLFLFNPFYC